MKVKILVMGQYVGVVQDDSKLLATIKVESGFQDIVKHYLQGIKAEVINKAEVTWLSD